MIINLKGNIFTHESTCIVNPVNCVGVMGKGLALQMKRKFPGMFEKYQNLCKTNSLRPGKIDFHSTGIECPEYIIFFPTKNHWRNPSKLEYIETGLPDLMKLLTFLE